MELAIGDMIPDFTLSDQNGDAFSLRDFLGSKPLVIFFYPKDFTPGCTKEVCDFRDHYEDFVQYGAEVVGISSDSSRSHRFFANTFKLPFKLLSDPGGQVRTKFGIKKNLMNLLPGRETFVVDKQGKLILAFRSAAAAKHMKQALEALKKLN